MISGHDADGRTAQNTLRPITAERLLVAQLVGPRGERDASLRDPERSTHPVEGVTLRQYSELAAREPSPGLLAQEA
ncbi:MAG TPA: hypothetical protein VGF67_17670 [Ktedonobacteraceae bacterium]|jgi:hypothetical protein